MGMVNSKPQTTLANALCGADLRCLIANYTPQDGGFMSMGWEITCGWVAVGASLSHPSSKM